MKSYAVLGLAALASAAKHHLFVGTFSGAYLYSLEFDDETLNLTLANNITAESAHSWIGLSHDKKALYGVGDGSWYSYAISNGTSLDYSASVNITGESSTDCSSSSAHGIFILGAKVPPYNVYADPFGNCANVLSVDANGALDAVVQNISFYNTSGVHGLAISPDNAYLYAADDSANSVWTYRIDNSTGLLTLQSTTDGPEDDSNPRHAAVHPNGKYLYVVLEETNELGQYKIGANGNPVWENVSYPLITPGLNDSSYWSDEVYVSPSGKYLWASSRSRDETTTGYISAFSLSSDGAITKQLFLTATTTSGGSANAVAPAFFSDEFVALTDTQDEFVQVWQFKNDSASIVAQVDLQDGGCCANAVWYD